MKRSALLVAIVLLDLGVRAAQAQVGGALIAVFTYVPGGTNLGPVATPPLPIALSITQGDTLSSTNLDPVPHSLTADDLDELGNPLFDTGLFGLAATAPVVGVENLQPGSYPFHCTTHAFMHGVLTVNAPYP